MAVAETERTEHGENGGSSPSRTALTAAAAAAATGAATYAIRKARSHEGDHEHSGDDGQGRSRSKQKGGGGSLVANAASSAWDSASEIVLPMAEDAAAAAGRYLAESAPDVVRERLVPRFIAAFNEAN